MTTGYTSESVLDDATTTNLLSLHRRTPNRPKAVGEAAYRRPVDQPDAANDDATTPTLLRSSLALCPSGIDRDLWPSSSLRVSHHVPTVLAGGRSGRCVRKVSI